MVENQEKYEERSWAACRFLFIVFLTAYPGSACFLVDGCPYPQERAPIELNISVSKAKYKLGEKIPIRIRLTNRGTEDVIVGKELLLFSNAPASVRILVFDEKGTPSRQSSWIPELPRSVRAAWWKALSPTQSLSSVEPIDKNSHSFLGKPGKYRIQVKYISHGTDGFDEETKTVDGKSLHPSQIWVGEAESNSVWIEIFQKK